MPSISRRAVIGSVAAAIPATATDATGEVAGHGVLPVANVATVERQKIKVGTRFIRTDGYYDPGDGGGAYYRRASNKLPLRGKIRSADGVWWELAERIVSPRMFGAVGDGKNDDTLALQAFFDYVSANNFDKAMIVGTFKVTSGIVAGPSSGAVATQLFECNATIVAAASIKDVLTFRGFWYADFLGRLRVIGTGGENFSTNTCTNGIRVQNSGRVRFGRLYAERFRGWGIYHGQGSSHFSTIEKASAYNCGSISSSRRSLTLTATGFDNIGTSNLNQRTVITVTDTLPTDIDLTRGFLIVAGYPYRIMATDVGTKTLSVYPWIPNGDQTDATYQICQGGGLLWGGQVAKTTINSIDTVRCGTGVWLHGNGSPLVQGFGGQFNGNDIVLGDGPSNVFGGSVINGAYFEATAYSQVLHMGQTSSASNGSFVNSSTSLNPAKIISPVLRTTKGASFNNRYFPVTLMVRNELWFPWSEPDVITGAETAAFIDFTLTNVPRPYARMARPHSATFTLNLVDDPHYRRLKGSVPVMFTMYGRGSRKGKGGGYTGKLTINAAAGFSINDTGNQSIAIAPQQNPVTYKAVLENDGLDTNIWRVTMVEEIPLDVQ